METRLIFCWSPGRCGTGYLAKMFQTIPGIVARHEPLPRFSEWTGDEATFWQEKKLPAIGEMEARIYVETAHPFRDYLPSLLELGVMPDVVQIHRNHRDVALSLWRRRSIPGRTGRGIEFLLQPTFAGWQQLTDYQLCYWHSREVERQGCERQGSVDRWLHVQFDELVNGDAFVGLVRQLNLPNPGREYERRRGWKVNGNPLNYYSQFPDGDLNVQEDEIDGRIHPAGTARRD